MWVLLHTDVLMHMYALKFLLCFHRCTILEPGPVITSGFQNSAAWSEPIDKSTADQKTQELMEVSLVKVMEAFRSALESSKIAAVVKEIILGKSTNFRCQINVDFLAGEIASKLKDPASNEPIDLITKRLFGEQKDKN